MTYQEWVYRYADMNASIVEQEELIHDLEIELSVLNVDLDSFGSDNYYVFAKYDTKEELETAINNLEDRIENEKDRLAEMKEERDDYYSMKPEESDDGDDGDETYHSEHGWYLPSH